MKLLVVELANEAVRQEITVGDFDLNIEAVRPHLYKHNAPAGGVYLEFQDNDFKVIATTNTVTITDIDAAAFFHGVVRFDVNVALKKNTNYWVELKSTGYTFSEAAYIGWIQDYDLRVVDADYVPNTDFSSALLIEFWKRAQDDRGAGL